MWGLSKTKRGPMRLIMGPWTHGARSTSHSGDVEFGVGSTLDADGGDLFARRLVWFDRYLKGMERRSAWRHRPRRAAGNGSEAPVRLFVMGGGSGRKTAQGRLDHGGRWRSERDWPVPDQKLTPYYLNATGRLSTAIPAAGAEAVTYDLIPRTRCRPWVAR